MEREYGDWILYTRAPYSVLLSSNFFSRIIFKKLTLVNNNPKHTYKYTSIRYVEDRPQRVVATAYQRDPIWNKAVAEVNEEHINYFSVKPWCGCIIRRFQ
ncbi:MAG: hypothetical protein K0R51_2316 [Cytophagaceae bacterium]|nr:hypothetical protein [Cytophagaceae bacterium]